ncbi:hypothetical protein ACWEQH_33425, partial [Streptomyces sp. NPDC004166]
GGATDQAYEAMSRVHGRTLSLDPRFLGVFPPGSRDQIDAPWKTAECGSSAIHGLKVGPVHPIR